MSPAGGQRRYIPFLTRPNEGRVKVGLPQHEVQKSERNLQLIEKLMQTTFALRCQEIVHENPLVKDFLEKWPALRMESQVHASFSVSPLYSDLYLSLFIFIVLHHN